MREDLAENLFDFLGSVALEENRGVLALRACAWNDGLIAAQMTDEPFLGSVIGEWHGAVTAFTDVATAGTLQGAGKAAAVEKKNNLLTILQLLFHVLNAALPQLPGLAVLCTANSNASSSDLSPIGHRGCGVRSNMAAAIPRRFGFLPTCVAIVLACSTAL